jgi:hypothetical protein
VIGQKTTSMPPTLSKSTFLRGIQCKKSLYLSWHRPELKDPVSPLQQAVFSHGHEVGLLAQQLFPGGIDAGSFIPEQYQKSIDLTTQLIKNGTEVIYEAGFSANDLHCFIDILVRDGDKWKAYEVKSSTQVKPVNLLDAAFQYQVMTLCGLKLSEIYIVTLNTAYERIGQIDLQKLFRIESVHKQVVKLQAKVQKSIEEFLATLNNPIEPVVDIGPHCFDPYHCNFHSHCWKHVPDYSIFNISRLSADKKWNLYHQGIMKFEDIPPDFSLNDSQWQQVISELKGETHINKAFIQQFIGSLNYPLYFLDFESFQPPVPLFDHCRPYQQVVSQYSMHWIKAPGLKLNHKAFLAETDGSDPRYPFIHQLISDIGDYGDIIVFNRAWKNHYKYPVSADVN